MTEPAINVTPLADTLTCHFETSQGKGRVQEIKGKRCFQGLEAFTGGFWLNTEGGLATKADGVRFIPYHKVDRIDREPRDQ